MLIDAAWLRLKRGTVGTTWTLRCVDGWQLQLKTTSEPTTLTVLTVIDRRGKSLAPRWWRDGKVSMVELVRWVNARGGADITLAADEPVAETPPPSRAAPTPRPPVGAPKVSADVDDTAVRFALIEPYDKPR